ncbi:MAG: TonB-dependent receptor plug domain-containing protein [Fluviicola sp.]|nr:TonB-dependent receptor plug domain-containing protein [Fluviicola sp.]
MKLKITFFILCLIYFKSSAQNIEILDQNSLKQLSGVEVFEVNSEIKLISDSKGKVDISSFSKTQKIIIKKDMYYEQIFSYEDLSKLNFKIYLIENLNSLEEVVVSASRFEERRKDVVQKIQLIRSSELQNMNQTSTADVMTNSGNIMVQKSQQGGGSPIIRGFETNKVLMVVDGVRMNNAIYRGGHVQNIITLDNAVMDKIEIVYGSGSVVYGSDIFQ